MKYYAGQYYHHVSAFPRYISALHSLCENAQDRKILLENLNDEEGRRGAPHPELWMHFAEGLGLKKEEVQNTPLCEEIKNVIDTFFHTAAPLILKGCQLFIVTNIKYLKLPRRR